MENKLLGIKQAAELLGLSPFTVESYARERKIPSIKVGRRVLFDPTALTVWLAERTRAAEPAKPAAA